MNKNQDVAARYDFIICGAGPAGCVLASRLATTTSARVLLVEAGPGARPLETVRADLWPKNIGTERDWQFESDREPALDGRRIALSAGRGMGGGSSINALVWARGHQRDWDDLADAAQNSAWDYEHALSTYRSIEKYAGPGDDRHYGRGGRLAVQQSSPARDGTVPRLGAAFLAATAAEGIPAFPEQNGRLQEAPAGASVTDLTKQAGERSSVVDAYLPAGLATGNLDVVSDTTVTRILVRHGRANGVEIVRGGEAITIEAGSEVILAAGALQTPALLQRSGIGDRRLLSAAGIDCTLHVPGVGLNLQDHPLVGSVWRTSALSPVSPSAQSVAFLNLGEAADAPDIYLLATEIPSADAQGDGVSWSIGAALLAPASRGRVMVKDADPFRPPSIRFDYLSDRQDMATMSRAVQLAQRLGNSAAMAEIASTSLAAPEGDGAAALDRYIREGARSGWHFSGSCRIGSDDLAVVDGDLRVREIAGLRIADTSVLPRVFRGNTMAPAIVIGERAGEMISGTNATTTGYGISRTS